MHAELMKEGYGSQGLGPVHLFEAFRQWQGAKFQESGSTSDFPKYLHENIVQPTFFRDFAAASSPWRQFANVTTLRDFKETTSVGLGEMPDLVEVIEDDDYMDSALGEMEGPKLKLKTFGRTFSIGRKTLINDDFGRLTEAPSMMARAAARTLAKSVLAILTGNPNAYDGTPLFDVAHGNAGTGALAEATLATAITAIQTQKNRNNEPIGIEPTTLVIPAALRFTAARILNSGLIPAPGTSLGGANPMQGIVTPVVEPYLTDATDWYLFSGNSVELAPIKVGFLNGKQEPTLLQHQTVATLGAGAYDPYELVVDKLTWKVRHDWAVAPGEWRGSYKATVAG